MNRKAAIRKAKVNFAKYICKRDNYTCFTCGMMLAENESSCGHLFTSSALNTKFDEENSNCQCQMCNIIHEQNDRIYTQKYIEKFGLKQYKELKKRYNQSIKLYTHDILEIAEKYKEKYENL